MTSFRPEGAEDQLLLIASTTVQQERGSPSALRLRIPRSRAYFTGVGAQPSAARLSPLDRHAWCGTRRMACQTHLL